MTTEAKDKKLKKRPFKWTKELVRLALNDGWTQTEIGDACRTQQSVVSDWSKGKKKAREYQLKSLLEIYGHKLRRNAFRVYWSLNFETSEQTFYRVEGKVIFSQAFFDYRRNGAKLKKKIPECKLVVHHQGENKFLVIHQRRIKSTSTNEELDHTLDDAIWSSSCFEKMTSEQLLDHVDLYIEKNLEKYPSDVVTLPFLIRQALLNHGLPIEGIVEYPASW